MSDCSGSSETLGMVAGILLKCFLLCVLLLLFWFWLIVFGGDFIYLVQSHFFRLSRQQFDLVNYCAIAMLKVSAFVLFLIPYIAVRQAGKDACSPSSSEAPADE